jgi:predicted house-cleaning NTP pyrophosphatase (Maf/HAM1 superfamily)
VRPQPCRWCGRDVADAGAGRRRQYCRQSCRQRAYEQRTQFTGGNATLPTDAVVLSADEAAALADRVYQVRCAAEDVATALDEGAGAGELRSLCQVLVSAAEAADGWR